MSTATTLKRIETALLARYAGMSITTSEPGVVPATTVAVAVFMEQPNPEEYPERVFPSVAIRLLSVSPDYDRSESEDDNEEPIGSPSADPVPLQPMRDMPQPMRVMYSIDTWHKVRTSQDRDLLSLALLKKTPPRGSMSVKNLENVDQDVWVAWSGNIVVQDEIDVDEVILHKSLAVEVFADLILDETLTSVATTVAVQWSVSSIKTVIPLGAASPERVVGEEVLDLVFRVLAASEEVVV